MYFYRFIILLNTYNKILQKLHGFIRKYYTNELIKGSILFLAFGLLYFIFTLFVEYFLWLKPTARTILFWLFIAVEVSLLIKYIVIPVFKLAGLTKGLSANDASKIIGTHFSEVDDKLLNMLQLHDSNVDSELVLASIDQKAENLQPIPFQKAIKFSTNKKYLKYLAIPLLIWLFTLLTGQNTKLNESYDRVVNHQLVYTPPAPFSFEITNPSLDVIEGGSIQLQIKTTGDIFPEEAKILFNEEDYFLKKQGGGNFTYQFDRVVIPINFYFEANNVRSKTFEIKPIPTPKIQGINLFLKYPSYVKKSDERIENTGNIMVPAGTFITWNIKTSQADSLHLVKNEKRFVFTNDEKNRNDFYLTRKCMNSFSYSIQVSNKHLRNYENLVFSIEVIQDEYPKMQIQTDIDSISRGEAQFIGSLSDDYGLSKLQLVYYARQNPDKKSSHSIKIQKANLADFYYVFPTGLYLQEGLDYEFYYEAFDNDVVSGPKSVKSKSYSYHEDTQNEKQEKLLQEEKEGFNKLQKTLEKQEKNRLNLEELKNELQNKPNIEFNDTKKIEQFIKRQEEYQQMMQRQTEQLQRNLDEQPKLKNELLEDKKEALKDRLEEAKELAKQDKLLEELRKMAEKLEKEDLLDRIKKMSKNNQQNEKSLEQLLELTKRFYVEQKAEQIREKLEELAKKQENLSKDENNSKEKQEELNKDFKDIQKSMEQLQKDNEELKQPMEIDPQKAEQQSVEEDQQKATEELEQQQKEKASKKQQSAAKKMKKMAGQMQMQMSAMQGEMIEEDIALLRSIIENLITFSYNQEDLMNDLRTMNNKHPSFAKKLKEQFQLKTYFEHIDDSLYVLSMRQAKLSQHINLYLANAHYYLDETLEHYADSQIPRAVADQHYVMTAANDLALLLSNLLDNMQSKMGMGMGKGKGKGQGMGFSLPDIIQKQGELSEGMKKAMKKGGKKTGEKEGEGEKGEKGEKGKEKGGKSGEGGQNSQNGKGEQMSQELFEIYKQQALLRQAIENQLNDLQGVGAKAQANKVKRQMEELERLLLEKGITNQVLQRMLRLEHELLKLKDAAQKQGEENKRQSTTNTKEFPKISPKQLEFKNKYLRQNEILNREVLPLRDSYKKKVRDYFKNNTE